MSFTHPFDIFFTTEQVYQSYMAWHKRDCTQFSIRFVKATKLPSPDGWLYAIYCLVNMKYAEKLFGYLHTRSYRIHHSMTEFLRKGRVQFIFLHSTVANKMEILTDQQYLSPYIEKFAEYWISRMLSETGSNSWAHN